mgnify:CR=1 FL=1
MQDSVFEFWSGDYELRLYVDRLDSFPIKNFRRCLRILREYPEDLDRLKAALQQYTGQAEESWNSASEAFVNGYKTVSKYSRKKKDLEILRKNKRLKSDLKRAKSRFEKFSERLTLIQNQQGGNQV